MKIDRDGPQALQGAGHGGLKNINFSRKEQRNWAVDKRRESGEGFCFFFKRWMTLRFDWAHYGNEPAE